MNDFEHRIGPFNCFFDEAPLYLEFLNLNGSELTIRLMQAVIENNAELEDQLFALLDHPDWRPHLVAAMAWLLDGRPDISEAMWRAFDTGSWVAPQLAVVLYFRDPRFSLHARHRLLLRCPVHQTPSIDAAEQICDQRFWKLQQAAKCMSALLALVTRIPGMAEWSRELEAQEDVRALLEQDCDDGRAITTGWMKTLVGQFGSLDIELVRSERS